MSYRKLGDLVKFISNKNTDGNATILFGINIDKFFMPSVANIVGVDLKKYKVVKKYQFACNRMHVGRDERLPISMSTFDYDFIVSPAYDVFEVISSKVLPEYLMLWFRRKEFDRQCWFYTDADVRGGLHLDALKSIEIKVPSIEEQRQIVAQYQSIANKIKVNEQICEKLEATAQALYKHWFVDFEFPNEEGKPYKSSGGKMVWNEELGKEIPEGWEVKSLGDNIDYKKGYAFKSEDYEFTGNCIIRVTDLGNKYVDSSDFYKIQMNKIYQNYSVKYKDVIITTVGSWPSNPLSVVGKVVRVPSFANDYYLNQNMVRLRFDHSLNEIIYQQITDKKFGEYLISGAQGSANQASITLEHIFNFRIVVCNDNMLNIPLNNLYEMIDLIINQNQKLTQLQSLLLSRLAVGEEVGA